MERALARLALSRTSCWVTACPVPARPRHEAIVDGRTRTVTQSPPRRDREDRARSPDGAPGRPASSYAWRAKGYGTPDHLAALAAFGFTPHHRKSFAPVVQLELMASPASIPS